MDDASFSGSKAKQYQRIKQRLSLFYLFWTPFLLFLIAYTPLTESLASFVSAPPYGRYGELAAYFTLFSLIFLAADVPLAFYSGYVIEHRYELSNQSLGSWIGFLAKKSTLSFLVSLLLLEVLYAFIWHFPGRWWLIAWISYAFFGFVVGKIFPVFIVPLFYRYDRVQDEDLRRRIFALTERYGMPVENLYSLNLSKTTKKANAAFMGIGKSKRVVLSDTLIENFTPEEIEVVVAHELGHFKHRDIVKQLSLGILSSLAGFWLIFQILDPLCRARGFEGAGDIAALPLLFLIFYLFSLILTPLQSAFSRWMERAADRFALEACRSVAAFVSCMQKLARVNLADPDPNPVYEWFFYDHPAISKRIGMANEWKKSQP